MVQEATDFLALGFGIGLSGQEVCDLMEAGFSAGQQCGQGARQKGSAGQVDSVELLSDGFGRIGLGHRAGLPDSLATSG